jgi:hypothetical protein
MSKFIVVEAVNKLRAATPTDGDTTVWRSHNASETFFHFGSVQTNDTICLVGEYNECVKELCEAKWMQVNPKPSIIFEAASDVTFSEWCNLHVQSMGNTIRSVKDANGCNLAWFDPVTDEYFIIDRS